ncbi:MAG TPA: TIM-barrel domain-containing protein [Ilumatobacteraceae bacterium]|nr:TIM-barrel domain-containing protein [Ilumatobacteraceae bacterium]
MIDTSNYIRFERVDSFEHIQHGLLARLHGEQLRIELVDVDMVRVKISRGGAFDESPTFAVCVDPLVDRVDFAVDQAAEVVRLRTSAMVVSLWLEPFRLDVHRTDGTPVVEAAADLAGNYWTYATLNDAFTVRRRCQPEDAIYGLGEKSGHQNRRGRDFTLWNTDIFDPERTKEFTAGRPSEDLRSERTSIEFDPYYISIPFFYHQSYPDGSMIGSFVDNGYRGEYDFTARDEYRIHFAGGQYTEYIFAGPQMPDILTRYTHLTGRIAIPPMWSLGYHQCRWAKYTQIAIEQLAQRHRDREIPCDTLWLDIEYMDGYRVFTWNTEAFPDVPGMLARLGQQGFGVITIIDPGVKYDPGYWVFDQALERNVLCKTDGGDVYIGQVWPGNTAFPDFVTEEARSWWGELNAAHVQSGLVGIWNDMNEPATGVIPPDAMRFGGGQYPHERFHNQYALLMAMGTTAGLLHAMPDKRTFVLSRAGFSGIQRYAANWMGDNLANWDHLWLSVPMATGLGISGQAFVGADIGGFEGDTNAELFLRWMQYATLTPFCRNHSAIGWVDQYAWSWGEVVEDLVRDAIRLRYRLLPYIYTSFVTSSETGAPVQRPLIFDHQHDHVVRDLDDEYLLGPDLLVAPALRSGLTARQVYLPDGTWYAWHTDEVVIGPRYVRADLTMDRIPLYARGGAVIPMWTTAPPSTAGYQPTAIELHVFVPAADGTYRSALQEDDGITFAANGGARLRTTFEVTRVGQQITVRSEIDGDGYPTFVRRQFDLVIHGTVAGVVIVDGTQRTFEGARFGLANDGKAFTIEFQAI